jgi:hypothetical protein
MQRLEQAKQQILELESDAWDAQIERDAKSGKLKKLEDRARAQIRAGRWKEI